MLICVVTVLFLQSILKLCFNNFVFHFLFLNYRMTTKGKLFIFFLLFLFKISVAQQIGPAVQTGISLSLADYRHNLISDIQYKLDFNITIEKSTDINGSDTIIFKLKSVDQPLQLDFKQSADHVRLITVNGKPIAVNLMQEDRKSVV